MQSQTILKEILRKKIQFEKKNYKDQIKKDSKIKGTIFKHENPNK